MQSRICSALRARMRRPWTLMMVQNEQLNGQPRPASMVPVPRPTNFPLRLDIGAGHRLIVKVRFVVEKIVIHPQPVHGRVLKETLPALLNLAGD